MRNIARLLAVSLALQPVLASAQSAPANLPAQSVYGRLGISGDTGPGQGIPFVNLLAALGGISGSPAGLAPSYPIYVTAPPFNAKCNGVTDDTAAIAAAIAATPVGGTLMLPAGSCLVSGTGSAIFTLTQPINIVGQGMSVTGAGSTILLSSSVPTSTDVFHIVPATNTSPRGFTFRKFNVNPQLGSVAQHVFHFDTTGGTTTNIGDIVISQVYANQNASAGGYSVFLDNGIGTNANGGELFTTVENSVLGGGLNCLFCGDSLRLLYNQILTLNAGFTIKQVAGAAGFQAIGNNIVAAGGNVISAAVNPVVGPGNTLEQQVTNNETNNSILDIQGAVSPKVFGNSIVGLSGTGNPLLVRFGTTTGGSVENNYLGGAGTGAQVTMTAGASAATVGPDNTFAGSGTALADSGSGTVVIGAPTNCAGASIYTTSTHSYGCNAPGQFPGTATNDNASAGNVGEYVSSTVLTGSAVSLVSATPKTVTSISLTAGDWDVSGVVYLNTATATSLTLLADSINTSTNALSTTPGQFWQTSQPATVPTAGVETMSLPPFRFSLAATTTIFLVADATFTSTAPTAYGIIQARRKR